MNTTPFTMQSGWSSGEHDTELDGLDLIAQMGAEIDSALGNALERVNALAATGRIDRSGLRALREEIDRARRTSVTGRQLARLASGRVRPSAERVDLTALVREALAARAKEIESRAIEVRQVLDPTEVLCDATLLFALIQGMIDWTFEYGKGRVDIAASPQTHRRPHEARLVCAYRQAAGLDDMESKLESMTWRLLETTSRLLGLRFGRKASAGYTQLVLALPRATEPADAATDSESSERHGSGANSKPLAGRHVLVIASRREIRTLVREAVHSMGLMLDFVGSVDEAREFCSGGVPHALLYEAALGGARMVRLHDELVGLAPHLAFIEVIEEGKAFEVVNRAGRQHSSVSRSALAQALPAALMFELSRTS